MMRVNLNIMWLLSISALMYPAGAEGLKGLLEPQANQPTTTFLAYMSGIVNPEELQQVIGGEEGASEEDIEELARKLCDSFWAQKDVAQKGSKKDSKS